MIRCPACHTPLNVGHLLGSCTSPAKTAAARANSKRPRTKGRKNKPRAKKA